MANDEIEEQTSSTTTGQDSNEERTGETGLVLRFEFPYAKVREEFLIAFRGWLKQYKQTAETAYLMRQLVAAQVVADDGEDTSGYYLRPQFVGGMGAPPPASAAVWLAGTAWGNSIICYSDWIPFFGG